MNSNNNIRPSFSLTKAPPIRPSRRQKDLATNPKPFERLCSSRTLRRSSPPHRHRSRKMSKKNKLSTRVKQHTFDLKREKEEQEKKAKKAEKQKAKVENSMKVDSGKVGKVGKQIKKKAFKVGKKRMKLSATTKAKAAQAIAMEIEK